MRPFALPAEQATAQNTVGCVLCHDVIAVGETGRVKLGKGHIVQPQDVQVLHGFGGELHLIAMDAGDIHEDEASTRLARAVAGEGLVPRGPVESQTLLRAAQRGLVEVNRAALEAINALPDVSVYTVFDGQLVDEAKAVAATKVTPLVVPGAVIEQAEQLAREAYPVVGVRPYQPGKVGIVVRERLAGGAKRKFEDSIRQKVGWFGGAVIGIHYAEDEVAEITGAFRQLLEAGATLILAAGVNSTDPLDLTLQALDCLGARTEKRGVPAHPGSTSWLSYAGEVPIFGLGLCGMFSQTTVMDLLLPRFMAGIQVTAADLAAIGHGGMLGKEMAYRFPNYETS